MKEKKHLFDIVSLLQLKAIIILHTEKFGHLYIVVCVIVGGPCVASLVLKNLRSGLRPTSSGLILSAKQYHQEPKFSKCRHELVRVVHSTEAYYIVLVLSRTRW